MTNWRAVASALIRFFPAVSLGITVVAVVEAQQTSTSPDRAYSRGTVIISSGERFQATNLVFARDTLTFRVKGSGERKSYPLGRVDYASRIRTRASEGALIGGGLILVSGVIAFVQAGDAPGTELKDNAALVVVGLTVAGALLGGLIGKAFTEEKSVIQNGRFVSHHSRPVRAEVYPGYAELPLVQFRVAF